MTSISCGVFLCLWATLVGAQVLVKPPAVPNRVLADLKSSNPDLRRKAADQIGSLRARAAARSLIIALSDKDAGVREAAGFALGQLTEPTAAGPLIKLLQDPDAEVRASTAFALGMIGDRKSEDAVSNALDDSEAGVRSAAVIALALIEDPESFDELVEMLNDSSFDVRYDVVWALGYLGEPEAAPHLRAALVNLDLIRVDERSREAFRQAVQNAVENLRFGETSRDGAAARPRRVGPTELQAAARVTRPAAIRQSVQPVSTERATRSRARGSVSLRVLR